MNSSTKLNWINGQTNNRNSISTIPKIDPHTGKEIYSLQDSNKNDVSEAISISKEISKHWSVKTSVQRGNILRKCVQEMRSNADVLAALVATETGKPIQDAEAEVDGAILQGDFFASEGLRLYGSTLNSAVTGKQTYSIREPLGAAALIVPANTPIANIAWKVFPALICGNTAILKASEDAPAIANMIGELFKSAGLPDGVLNIIQGRGQTAGSYLVEDPRIDLVSFTGSTKAGKEIAKTGGQRLARISLELGGKNPFIVCNDADVDNAVHWATLSAFSNAGQRCAAASRLFVHSDIYHQFLDKFVEKSSKLKLGIDRGCDLGPVINSKQYFRILQMIERTESSGAEILTGGKKRPNHLPEKGFYIMPTIIGNTDNNDPINQEEIFGPVVTIQKYEDYEILLSQANNTLYGLTSAVHTKSLDLAAWFSRHLRNGVVNINAGTYGSEPQFPFGGFGNSGNGTREPGSEALNVYTELKVVSFLSASPF